MLVSVYVQAYNSQNTILETLNSIRSQTYNNIELIVSDDCSQDTTVDVARQWLDDNKNRFVNARLLTSDHNTGVSANSNRALRECRGEWVMSVAADDILLPSCIADFVDYTENDKNLSAVFSRFRPFGEMADNNGVVCADFSRVFSVLSEKELVSLILYVDFLPSPSSVIKRQTLEELGFYNEQIPFIEDWPFWIKLLVNKNKVGYFDKETVLYRIHPHSLSQNHNKDFEESLCLARQYAARVGSMYESVLFSRLFFYMDEKLLKQKNKLSILFYKGMKCLNPYFFYRKYLFWKFNYLCR